MTTLTTTTLKPLHAATPSQEHPNDVGGLGVGVAGFVVCQVFGIVQRYINFRLVVGVAVVVVAVGVFVVCQVPGIDLLDEAAITPGSSLVSLSSDHSLTSPRGIAIASPK